MLRLRLRLAIPKACAAVARGAHGAGVLTALGAGVALGVAVGASSATCEPTRIATPPPPSPPPPSKAEFKAVLAGINAQLDSIESNIGTVAGESDDGHITIVGAGLVGSLVACILREKGLRVSIYERYQDIRTIPSTGRSINLIITSRGLRAVDGLGGNLRKDLENMSTQVTHRTIHQTSGEIMFQRYGKDDTEYNNSISRYELNKYLIHKAEAAGAKIYFNQSLVSADFSGEGATGGVLTFSTRDADGTEHTEVLKTSGPVIACDGGGSGVRRSLVKDGLTSASEELLSQGYKEMLFPKTTGTGTEAGRETSLVRYGLHIWPRGKHMTMALSNLDGSFTGTVYMEKEGPESFAALKDEAAAAEFLARHYPSALPLIGGMESAVKQLAHNPVGILGTVRTDTWHVGGKVLLIGDAAHAIVPFFGQGCNCGFEDCLELSRLVDKHCAGEGPKDWEACFAALQLARKTNANAIADMALENYVEMQEKTGDRGFLLRKAVENKIEKAHEDKFRSRYAMVVYGGAGNITYRNAYKLGEVQWEILDELCEGLESPDQVDMVDMGRALQLIEQKLKPVQQALGIDLSTVSH